MFDDILKRENATLDNKKKKLIKPNIGIFPKRLVRTFGQKLTLFHIFISPKKWRKNVFDDILERKNTFLGYKNKKFKRSNN